MKIIYSLLLTAVVALACKKDGGSGKKLYLGKVYSNDLLSEEYIYSSDKKAIRRNRYTTHSGVSNFAGFRLYEYENDLITRVLAYNKDGVLIDKTNISYNAAGKITRLDLYGNNEMLDYYYIWEYNNQELSKIVGYSPNPTKKQGEWLVENNTHNSVVSFRRYYVSSGNLYLSDSAYFTYADKKIPDHWQFYEELMYDFPIDITLESIFSTSVKYHNIAVGPYKATYTFSEKTYNGQGYLISQHYKLEADAGLGVTATNLNMKYEYIE